jgi:4-diphosphocytidyl-2-C-methyl-D-erythritol kinase
MERTGVSMTVSIQLDKRIPIGSGLGGGSSDAAAVLLALNRVTGGANPESQLAHWAVELGADVPFFVYGRPARLRGVGELIEPVLCLPEGHFVVAFPNLPLSTAEVYRKYDASLTNPEVERSIHPLNLDRTQLPHFLANDLEKAAVRIIPEIDSLKQRLRDLGAVVALMTGSGSAVFGVWDNQGEAAAAEQVISKEGTWARAVELLARAPEMSWAG